jgi:tyrosinase
MIARRVVHVLVAVVAIVLSTQAGTEAQTPQVRMRWQDFISGPDGAKRLASLQKAVATMKSLDASPKDSADYRRSWQYWANIHGYYGPQSPDGTVADQIKWLKANGFNQYVNYYQGITDQTPPDVVANEIWATCQHTSGTPQANFFGWHRMYLYYFERVLRRAANDDTLRLPYWDYTDLAQLALPAPFRDTASTLHDQKRKPRINTGKTTLDKNSTNVNKLLPEPNYLKYELAIEQGIHGYVHCTVGPTCPVAHMGDVPVAGNDPVFYSHHANIDRLWACWQQAHVTQPDSWQEQKFSFVDETGAKQTRPVKDFLDSATLGYVYDNVTACARPVGLASAAAPPSPAAASAPAGERKMAKVHGSKSIAVNSPTTTVDLAVPRLKLEGALADLRTPGSVELVLRDITASSHPGTMFDVFLAKKSAPAQRQHIGTISWFGAFSHRHGGQRGPEKKTLTFDVTDELRALGSGTAASGLIVVIEATDGQVSDDPATQSVLRAEARKSFRAKAYLRIGSIELHAVPAPGSNK